MVLLIIILILLDQITKYFLTSTINYGAAFGILQNQRLLLIIISLVVARMNTSGSSIMNFFRFGVS